MPKPIELHLTPEQRSELRKVRDHDPRPYLRERAAAILKVADGQSGRQTALHGLLKPHWPDTVYEWIKRYLAEGIQGLIIRPGRGRKAAFFQSTQTKKASAKPSSTQ